MLFNTLVEGSSKVLVCQWSGVHCLSALSLLVHIFKEIYLQSQLANFDQTLLFLTVPSVVLQFVTVVFHDHTHLLFHLIKHPQVETNAA